MKFIGFDVETREDSVWVRPPVKYVEELLSRLSSMEDTAGVTLFREVEKVLGKLQHAGQVLTGLRWRCRPVYEDLAVVVSSLRAEGLAEAEV